MARLSTPGQIALPVFDADRAEALHGEKLGPTRLFRFGHLAFLRDPDRNLLAVMEEKR